MIHDFQKIVKPKSDFNLIGRVKVKLLIFLSCLLFLLIVTQLVFAAGLATDGQRMQEIYAQIQRLELENTKLKVEIAQNSSLATLSQKAQDAGFTKPTKIITP